MIEPERRTAGLVSYRHPADIDGEPEEVAAASITALADITAAAHEVASGALAQARNAALEAADELTGSAVLEWEDSFEGRALAALVRTTEQVRRAAGVLAQRRARG